MATVYRARDRYTGDLVALKLLHETEASVVLGDGERFAREAQLLAELRHPNIVGYIAHGQTVQGQRFLVMEWLQGETLAQRLSRKPLPLTESLLLIQRVAEALDFAHQRGIVHRDLKPANLFLPEGDSARVKTLDFGIARHLAASKALTRTGTIVGTPEYMAPEQARGVRQLTPAVDVFSLGCILYECLTGEPPFAAEYVDAVLVRLLFEEPIPVAQRCAGIPDAVSALVGKMLAKDPTQRIGDAAAVACAVAALGEIRDLPLQAGPTQIAAPLVDSEQVVLSLVLALAPENLTTTDVTLSSAEALAEMEQHGPLLSELRALGVSVDLLLGNALLITVPQLQSAKDQAAVAAHCATMIRARIPNMRVAVVTGRGSRSRGFLIGDAIERAWRLLDRPIHTDGKSGKTNGPISQQILLDEVSADLLVTRFEVRRVGESIVLEGAQVEDDLSRRLLGKPTPCVGRDSELASLEATLSACRDESVARAVVLLAPPGLGKSRLRHELSRRLKAREEPLLILLGRGDPMKAQSPYGLLGEALRGACQVHEARELAHEQASFKEWVGQYVPPAQAQRVVEFLGELCGLALPDTQSPQLRAARQDPRIMSAQVEQAWLDWLQAATQEQPVLLLLEDLHWADSLTVKLVEIALQRFRDRPFMVLALSRPEVQELYPNLWAGAVQIERLHPLAKRASERLARQILGPGATAELVARIAEQSAGNPLFLEELIRAATERHSSELPETLMAILQVRIGALSADCRRALLLASVFGQTFAQNGIRSLMTALHGQKTVEVTLEKLVQEEIIETRPPEPSTSIDSPTENLEYRFRHALVRDAAYGLLTDDNRVIAHRLVGGYLAQVGGADPAVIAEHAYKGQDPDNAARFYVAAAERALARFDLDLADRYAQRALECGVKKTQAGIIRAFQARTAYYRLDMLTGYSHALDAIADLPSGSLWWTRTVEICFHSFFVLNRMEHADRLITAFLESTPAPDTRVAYLEAGMILNLFFTVGGRQQASIRLVDKMTQVASDLDPQDRGYLYCAVSYRDYFLFPKPFAAVANAKHAVELLRANGDCGWLPEILLNLGLSYARIGLLTQGEAILREGRAVALTNGNAFYAVVLHLHLGFNLAEQASAAKQQEARAIAELYLNQPLGPTVRGLAGHILGQVLMNAGDLAAAEPVLRSSLERISPILSFRLTILPLWIELCLKQGRIDEARQVAEEALRLLEENEIFGFQEVPLRLAVTQARFAADDRDAGNSELRKTLAQVRLRTDEIEDSEMSESYLNLAANREVLSLCQAHGLI